MLPVLTSSRFDIINNNSITIFFPNLLLLSCYCVHCLWSEEKRNRMKNKIHRRCRHICRWVVDSDRTQAPRTTKNSMNGKWQTKRCTTRIASGEKCKTKKCAQCTFDVLHTVHTPECKTRNKYVPTNARSLARARESMKKQKCRNGEKDTRHTASRLQIIVFTW